MTSELHNLQYYIKIFLEIQKFMKVGEEHTEVQEEIISSNFAVQEEKVIKKLAI